MVSVTYILTLPTVSGYHPLLGVISDDPIIIFSISLPYYAPFVATSHGDYSQKFTPCPLTLTVKCYT